MKKKMVKGENGTMGRGRYLRAAWRDDLAETLGDGGVQQVPKSAPGAAGGPSGNQTNTRNLFLSKMRNEGGKAVADACGARGTGATLERAPIIQRRSAGPLQTPLTPHLLRPQQETKNNPNVHQSHSHKEI
jgi:hypothetical protein